MLTEFELRLVKALRLATRELDEWYNTYCVNGTSSEPHTKGVLAVCKKLLHEAEVV